MVYTTLIGRRRRSHHIYLKMIFFIANKVRCAQVSKLQKSSCRRRRLRADADGVLGADVHQRAPIRTAQCILRAYMNRCGKQAALACSCATCSTRSHASCVIAAFHGRQRASGMCACTASYDTCEGTGARAGAMLPTWHQCSSETIWR